MIQYIRKKTTWNLLTQNFFTATLIISFFVTTLFVSFEDLDSTMMLLSFQKAPVAVCLLQLYLAFEFCQRHVTAFTPVTTRTHIQRDNSRLFASTLLEEPMVETIQPRTFTKNEIVAAQIAAEKNVLYNCDIYAMNALFVNVEEHPNPEPCTVVDGSNQLPFDFPSGCWLRTGPNGAEKHDGWLDGDGLIHCVTIPPPTNTNVKQPLYSSTYVETRGRTMEKDAQRNGKNFKFRGTLGAAPKGLPMLKNLMKNGIEFNTLTVQKDTCNTALAISGNRILALMEQSPPSEIRVSKDGRVETVESMCRLDGVIGDAPITGGNLGAHGRTDPRSGERIHVTYNSNDRPFVRIDSFDDDWELQRSIGVDVPAPVMVHDCAITENYVVILDFPLTVRPRRFLQDSFPVEYEPDHGARIGLTLRKPELNVDGTEDYPTLWFDVEPGVVLHAANAYERKDGKVVIHGFKAIPKENKSYILDYTCPFLHEWVVDPARMRVVEDRCLNPEEVLEFPIVEDDSVSKDADYVYGLQTTGVGSPILQFTTPDSGALLDGFVKLSLKDDDAGTVVGRFRLPQGWHFVSEPCVVKKTTGTGHYVVLCATDVPENSSVRNRNHERVARDGKSMKSQLLIFDGDYISSGPVTSIETPYHLNYGLHSLFVPWDKLQ